MYLHKLNSYLLKYCHQSIQTFWAFCTAVNLFQYIYRERERHTGHMQAPMDKTHKPSSMETTWGWWPSGWQNDQSEGFTWPQSVKHTQTHPPICIQPPVFIDTRAQWPNTGTHTPHSCWSVHTIRLRLINHWAQPSLCLLSLIWVYCLFVSGLWNIH